MFIKSFAILLNLQFQLPVVSTSHPLGDLMWFHNFLQGLNPPLFVFRRLLFEVVLILLMSIVSSSRVIGQFLESLCRGKW